jgi:Ca-activated chloride channel family protein
MRVHRRTQKARQGFPATLIFVLLVLSPAASAQRTDKPDRLPPAVNSESISINTDLISLTVTVTEDRGRLVSGLGAEAFEVFEDNVKQQITHFSGADSPISVAVVFDLSGSMSEKKLEQAREALRRFIETSHDRDEYSLIGFNQHPRLLADRVRDGDLLLRQLDGARAGGHTALYDAFAFGLEHVSTGFYSRRAVVVISDGDDNRSRTSFERVKRMMWESDAIVYAVGISGYALPRQTGDSNLKQLAEASGGRAFFPDDAGRMCKAFEQIALELRSQYSIGYAPANFAADGKWRRVKVRLKETGGSANLKLRSRPGYYADRRRESLARAIPD